MKNVNAIASKVVLPLSEWQTAKSCLSVGSTVIVVPDEELVKELRKLLGIKRDVEAGND